MEEACPVPDYFLARLYRSNAVEASDLLPSAAFSDPRPARSLRCSARPACILRELARTIAATCTQSTLMREGRESGRVLWEEAMRGSPDPHGFLVATQRRDVGRCGQLAPLQLLPLESDEPELWTILETDLLGELART